MQQSLTLSLTSVWRVILHRQPDCYLTLSDYHNLHLLSSHCHHPLICRAVYHGCFLNETLNHKNYLYSKCIYYKCIVSVTKTFSTFALAFKCFSKTLQKNVKLAIQPAKRAISSETFFFQGKGLRSFSLY